MPAPIPKQRQRTTTSRTTMMTTTTRTTTTTKVRGASIIKIGFWGPLYHSYKKEPPKIDHYNVSLPTKTPTNRTTRRPPAPGDYDETTSRPAKTTMRPPGDRREITKESQRTTNGRQTLCKRSGAKRNLCTAPQPETHAPTDPM